MSGQLSCRSPHLQHQIAVVGSVRGLAFAGDMVKYGYDVTVFEALHELEEYSVTASPSFVSNDIVDIEIEGLGRWGEIRNKLHHRQDHLSGRPPEEGYKAIFVGSGGLPTSNRVKPEWHHVVQRVPHACQPDASRRPGERHPGTHRRR